VLCGGREGRRSERGACGSPPSPRLGRGVPGCPRLLPRPGTAPSGRWARGHPLLGSPAAVSCPAFALASFLGKAVKFWPRSLVSRYPVPCGSVSSPGEGEAFYPPPFILPRSDQSGFLAGAGEPQWGRCRGPALLPRGRTGRRAGVVGTKVTEPRTTVNIFWFVLLLSNKSFLVLGRFF